MATISKNWNTDWLKGTDLGSTIPSYIGTGGGDANRGLSSAIQERMKNAGLSWPTATASEVDGVPCISSDNFVAGEWTVFGVTGGGVLPDKTNKLFKVTATDATVKGNLAVTGAITQGNLITLVGGVVECPVYSGGIVKFQWSGAPGSMMTIPLNVTTMTLNSVQISMIRPGITATEPYNITGVISIETPTVVGGQITAWTLRGSTHHWQINTGNKGIQVTSFSCPTTLNAGEIIYVGVDASSSSGSPDTEQAGITITATLTRAS